MPDTIQITQVSKSFGRIRALDAVSLAVPQRSIFGLVGPNGAGKTTLFSIVAGFLKADQGGIDVLGIDCRKVAQLHGRLSTFPQDAQFQRNIPILDQLVFFQRLAGRSRPDAQADVLKTLDRVGLGQMTKRRVGTLSHGMIKRLGVAQAFLGQPEVILLDEPMAGLDPANARQIRDLIRELQAQATIVISSHNLQEIQELCDHVGILDHGRLVLAGPMDEIIRSDRRFDLLLSRQLQNDEQSRLCSLPGVRQVTPLHAGALPEGQSVPYEVTLDFTDHKQDAVVSAVLKCVLDMGIAPRRLTEGRSLETHFLEITGGNKNN
jgi:ABC-2 type transport system ATP-binding protein